MVTAISLAMTDADAAALARDIALANGHGPVLRVRRLATGNCHYVHAVDTTACSIIVRIARPENRHLIDQAIRLNALLRPLGVPLPTILQADPTAAAPFMILERLPGRDLGDVYTTMSSSDRQLLATRMQAIHERLHVLPRGNGYGHAAAFDGDLRHPDLLAMVRGSLDQARRWVAAAGLLTTGFIDPIEAAFHRHTDLLATIPPEPYLHDTTTKNVMIDGARLAGIVDVDDLGYGDPAHTIALTKTAVAYHQLPPDYPEFWAAAAGLGADRRRLLSLYVAECAALFVGEHGNAFNRDQAPAVAIDDLRRLFRIIAEALDAAEPGAGRTLPPLEACLLRS